MQTTGLRGAHLSLQQRRLWSFLQENPVYRVQGSFLLQGRIDYPMFLRALHRVSEQHEIFCTVFQHLKGMEIPIQAIGSVPELACSIINLEHMDTVEQRAVLEEHYARLQEQSFDLAHGPLLIALLFCLSPEKYQLFICSSALCMDAFALPHFIAAWMRCYDACLRDEALDLDPLQYTAVSAWQNELLEAEDAKVPQEYWQNIDLAQQAEMPLPFLPTRGMLSYSSPARALSFKPQTLPIAVDEEILSVSRLTRIAAALPASLPALLFTCWQGVLWRLTGDNRLIVGFVGDGRDDEELTGALGLYSRVVPIELLFDEAWTFTQAACAAHGLVTTAIDWQSYFVWPAQGSGEEGKQNTYFPFVFEYNNFPAKIQGETVTVSLARCVDCTEPFAIKLRALQTDEHLELELQYDEASFQASLALRLGESLRALLSAALEQPWMCMRDLPVMDSARQKQLLKSFCEPRKPLPVAGFCQLFEQQARRFPHQLALVSAEGCLTYHYVNQRANQLARILRRYGVGPNVAVGLCLQRSSWMIVSMLAIFKAGGAYVPCDPDVPAARLLYQIRDMQTPLLLTQKTSLPVLQEWSGEILYLETLWQTLAQEGDDNLDLPVQAEDLAYVIYTSGSTGLPKGVMISQRNVVHYTTAMCERLRTEPGWQYATVSTLAADLGNTAIFCALASGGCLHILDYATLTASSAFRRWNRESPIDILKIVPSHLSALLSDEETVDLLPRRALILGGETLTTKLVARVRALGASCAIYNHYGPTEATIGVLVNRLELPVLDACGENDSIPLGRPISNTDVYVLDASGQVAPVGVTGELFIGGLGLSAGYLRRPEQTAERFVPHPFSDEEGARLYRTGDQVRSTADGLIEFVGRRDTQIKLRGYRIELGEIETVLRRHPNIWDCVVVLHKDGVESPSLVAYLVPEDQPAPTEEDLRVFLGLHLPAYMLPSSFVVLKDLPLTANGKVDRQRLPRPESRKEVALEGAVAPRSPLEEMLLDIWKGLLAVSTLGIHDNFFQVGGHSLLATQVISRVQAIVPVEISLASLFQAPTIAGLAQRIEEALRGGAQVELPPLLPVARTQDLPLSFAQQRLWFLDRLEPESIAYLVRNARWLSGTLDVSVLERALEALVQRHESLRTTIVEQVGHAAQVIGSRTSRAFPIVDLQGLGEAEAVATAHQLADQEGRQPCNLARGPLFRTTLLRVSSEEHLFLWTLHHSISDAWSAEIFVRELTTLYQAFSQGQPSPLPPLPIQYADFAVWQRQWMRGEILERHLAYWRQQLAGIRPLELPTDRPRPPEKTYWGAYLARQLPELLQTQLSAFSHQEGVTLFMVLLAAFQMLLAHYTGQDDISVGTPIANRTRAEVEGLIGFFVNTLVLRTDLSGNPSFVELLRRVRTVALGAYAHQDVPFEYLVEQMQPERDLSRSPLFQVMFTMQQVAENTAGTGRWQVEESDSDCLELEHGTTKFDLTFSVTSHPQQLVCGVEYNTDLFDVTTIEQFLRHWQTVLEAVVATPEMHIDCLPLLSRAEQDQILTTWNATGLPLPASLCLHHLFENQVMRTPDAIALQHEEYILSYAALNALANQLAWRFLCLGVGPEWLLGICLPRSLEGIIALLGCLKAGGAYVPLDPSMPSERLKDLARRAGLTVLLGQGSADVWTDDGLPPRISVQEIWREMAREPIDNPRTAVIPTNAAYMIYTSGSTGAAKGVLVSHRNVVNSTLARVDSYPTPVKNFLLLSPLFFDSSVAGLYWTLCQGGRLVVPREDYAQELEKLALYIWQEGISHLLCVPSLYALLLHLGSAELLCGLDAAIVAGEVCRPGLVQQHRALLADVAFYNEYGPTEATVWCSVYRLPNDSQLPSPVPIGRPIANAQLYVFDRQGQPVPVGMAGELFIGGEGVARGYQGQAGLTAERFVPHPYSEHPGARLYRTGDLVRYRPDGTLEFLGREDQQVKLRGYRIELGEIEHVLSEHPRVQESIVVLREEKGRAPELVGYIRVENEDARLSDEQLRAYLRGRLPDYMVPVRYVSMSQFPQTSTGKVDRRNLPAPATSEGEIVDLQGEIEELLGQVWSEVLRVPVQERHRQFFELGGHSLLASQVISRVRTVLGVELPLRALFEAPTIAQLARRVEQKRRDFPEQEQVLPPLLPLGRSGQSFPLSFAQQRLWFLDQLEPDSTLYLIPGAWLLSGQLNRIALQRSLQEVVRCHESLRTTFEIAGDLPVQVIHPVSLFPLPLIDLQGLEREESEQQAQMLADQENRQPCDLRRGPLFRAWLVYLADEEYVLLTTMHHIISDGWSNEIFLREFTTLYQAFDKGQRSPLSPAPVQYADFALWQRAWLQGAVLEQQLAYWRGQLEDGTPLNLPLDHPRPPVQSHQGAWQALQLPAALSSDLQALSQREHVTLFMLLLAAFQVLLARYSGQQDIAVGTTIANRTRSELEGLIGFFVNTLVLRTRWQGNPGFIEFLSQVRAQALDAYTYQDVPFERLVEMLQPERDLSRSPLFQVMFSLQQRAASSSPTAPHALGPLRLQKLPRADATTKFDLTFNVIVDSQGLHCQVEYCKDLFAPEMIQRLLHHWQNLLQAIVLQPESAIYDLPLLSSLELQQCVWDWNATETAYPLEKPVHTLFEDQVVSVPEAIAAVCGEAHITYAALNEKTNLLADHLRTLGVGPDVLVGLYMHRSLEMLAGLLGVLKAGGAYVPLDPTYPADRLAFMGEDSQIAVLITQPELLHTLFPHSVQVVTLAADPRGWPVADIFAGNLTVPVLSQHLAYVIYTSGSTGQPKGVAIPHCAVHNFLRSMRRVPGMSAGDRVMAITSLSFDIAVLELLLPLTVGAMVQIVSHEAAADGVELAGQLTRGGATVVQATPTTWRMLLNESWDGTNLKVLCGGEVLPGELAGRLFARSASLWNMYGPTETTIWSALAHVSAESERITIGRAIDNTQIYVLDTILQPVPVGVTGELYIAGDGLARGYLRRPAISAERFLPNPWAKQPGARMYRTGDLARWLPDGTLECLGRMDRQEKVRGFRIELGEIELALGQHEAVKECIVVVREDPSGNRELVAYLIAEPEPSSAELRRYVQAKLPGYMVPSHFVMVKTFPQTPNGKIDHRSLPIPEKLADEAWQAETAGAASTPIEEMLTEIWRTVLGRAQVNRHDDFFSSGGHSLLATQLISRVRTMMRVELPLRALFETPTLAGLVQQVERLVRGESRMTAPLLLPVTRTRALPLSFAQQRLWFLDQMEPGGSAYTMPTSAQLHGVLHLAALEQSLRALVERHESLRTTFQMGADGQPMQCIHPVALHTLRLIDLSGLMVPQREQQARRLAQEEAHYPFDLAQGPLLRATLLRLGAQEHLFLLTMHHIVTDAWSQGILVRELSVLYRAFIQGEPSPLPLLSIHYADYAVWQREWLRDQVLEHLIHYWQTQLRGLTTLELPTDHPRPAVQTFQGAQLSHLLPLELCQLLQVFAWQQGVTLFMLLLAAFQVLLAGYSGQDDIVVGTPIANRTQQEAEELIGFFVNTLVLRSDLAGGPSFLELLQQVREVCLGAYAHQDLPFEKLVEVMQPERDLSRTPLFQVLFILQNAPRTQDTLPGLREENNLLVAQEVSARFDLTLTVTDLVPGLSCAIDYDRALFEQETVRRLLSYWEHLLEKILENPQGRIDRLDLLKSDEYKYLALQSNANRVVFPEEYRLHALFAEQARAYSEAIALVFEGQHLSYGELERRANQLGHWLQRQGVGPDRLVGLYLDRSLELVIGVLGILKAGGAYLPLDPSYPEQRLAFMLAEADAPIVLAQRHLLAGSSLSFSRVLALDSDWSQVAGESPLEPESSLLPEHLAYVIYTSGSSGRPKGVGVAHQAITNRVRWSQQSFPLDRDDRFLQLASINFDIALWELLGPLMAGAQVVLAPAIAGQESALLASLLVEQRITVAHFVPVLLRHLLDEPALSQVSQLRFVFCGGEAWWPRLGQRFMQHQRAKLVQFYGPTEAAISVTVWTCPAERIPAIAPLGRPIANTQIYLLDPHGRPVPAGVPGELYLGGACLARGYMGRPDLTAERFVPHPLSEEPGARLYRTGDRARYLADGQIEYLGRSDQQVKVRGVRVEPGELETLLSGHEAVAACVVSARADNQGNLRLIAYIVLKAGQTCSGQTLRQWLREYVPEAMIPSQFCFLETLPLTSSGKVDRRALLLLEEHQEEQEEQEEEMQAPQRPLEELLEQVWREVLGRAQVGLHEDFFALGGHSLLATQIISRVRQLCGVEIPLRSLFERPTIATLAVQIEQMLRGASEAGEPHGPPLIPVPRGGSLPLSFAQRRLWFIDQLQPDSAAYVILAIRRIHGALNVVALIQSLQEMFRRHESLRTTFYTVAGQPVQVIHDQLSLRLPFIDLQGLEIGVAIQTAQQLAREEATQPYNLAQGPLLRVWLIRLEPQRQVLIVTMHHIISDGWSNEIFMHEWAVLYQAFVHNQSALLPPLLIQYADFAIWQHQRLQGAVLETLLDYWTRQLGGAPAIQLPADHPRPKVQSYAGASYTFVLPVELSQSLVALSRREGVTLFMALLAAFQVLLYRYTHQEDIVVGTDSANRDWAETEPLIGFFVNLLALRTNLRGKPSFRAVLARVREVVLEAYTHREMPFDFLVEKLAPAQRLDRTPLVQVLFVMQNLPSPEKKITPAAQLSTTTPRLDESLSAAAGEKEASQVPLPALHVDAVVSAKFDLALFMEERDEQLYGTLNYCRDLFEANTIVAMMARFQTLLHSVVRQPDALIDALDFFTDTELARQNREEQSMRKELRMPGNARINFPEFDAGEWR